MERRAPDDPKPPVEPHAAATLVLVRPGAAGGGFEVLLTRRPDSMAFAGGLHVFPGGRVEATDVAAATESNRGVRVDGQAADPGSHLAQRIAAVRETHEEVGVQLRPDALVEIAHWITPRAYPRRFDVRFYVAQMPPRAVLVPDPREVVDHVWLTPRDALRAMRDGTIRLWPPTSTTLQRLERAASFEAVRIGLGRRPDVSIRVEQIEPGVTVVTGRSSFGPEGRPANTVLVGQRNVVVVDPGDPDEDVLDAIQATVAAAGGRIVAIALTHVDPGHAAGSEELHERTGLPILVGPGGAAPLSWDVTEIADGTSVGRGDGTLRTVATPGHRPDHLAFLRSDGMLLTGDAMTDRPTLILPPEGDPVAQQATIARIEALIADGAVSRMIPGHGPPFVVDPAATTKRR